MKITDIPIEVPPRILCPPRVCQWKLSVCQWELEQVVNGLPITRRIATLHINEGKQKPSVSLIQDGIIQADFPLNDDIADLFMTLCRDPGFVTSAKGNGMICASPSSGKDLLELSISENRAVFDFKDCGSFPCPQLLDALKWVLHAGPLPEAQQPKAQPEPQPGLQPGPQLTKQVSGSKAYIINKNGRVIEFRYVRKPEEKAPYVIISALDFNLTPNPLIQDFIWEEALTKFSQAFGTIPIPDPSPCGERNAFSWSVPGVATVELKWAGNKAFLTEIGSGVHAGHISSDQINRYFQWVSSPQASDEILRPIDHIETPKPQKPRYGSPEARELVRQAAEHVREWQESQEIQIECDAYDKGDLFG